MDALEFIFEWSGWGFEGDRSFMLGWAIRIHKDFLQILDDAPKKKDYKIANN